MGLFRAISEQFMKTYIIMSGNDQVMLGNVPEIIPGILPEMALNGPEWPGNGPEIVRKWLKKPILEMSLIPKVQVSYPSNFDL